MSDIKICRQTLNKFKTNQTFSGDKAYIGETQITTPHKKPKKGKLTENQIEENKALSSNRIFVEHLIRVVKVFFVVIFRGYPPEEKNSDLHDWSIKTSVS